MYGRTDTVTLAFLEDDRQSERRQVERNERTNEQTNELPGW